MKEKNNLINGKKMRQKLYELQAQMCQVFTSSKRLEILNLLREKELSVGQVAMLLNIRQANLSQHLTILRERGVVKTRREGVVIYYSLSNPKIIKAFDIIKEILFEKMSKDGRFFQRISKGKRS